MSDQLAIVVWNVAHGSAMFARTPNNRTILMDAGASEDFSPAEHLHQVYGLKSTDMLILSHADADHVRDLPNVVRLVPPAVFYRNNTAPRHLVFPTDPPPVDPLKTFDGVNQRYVDTVTPWNNPHNAANWGGVVMSTFWPTPINNFTCLNNYSLVTVLDFGNTLTFVFPGDLEAPGFDALMKYPDFVNATTPGNRYRVLIAPHHGHSAGVHHAFLNHFSPHLSIISGAWGDPHTDTATYSTASGGLRVLNRTTNTVSTCKVLTTKRNDSVLLLADDKGLTITV